MHFFKEPTRVDCFFLISIFFTTSHLEYSLSCPLFEKPKKNNPYRPLTSFVLALVSRFFGKSKVFKKNHNSLLEFG
jgi:hypothetical protein